ncbi:hypothetical protein N9P43_03830, partial [Planktomarina temperata]|nr:hypothetical protein [Planktomarina temperata]
FSPMASVIACAVLLAALMATVNRVFRSTSVTRTEGPCLPIAVLAFHSPHADGQVHNFRTFLNGNCILGLTAPLDTTIALAPLLLTSQAGVKIATVALIRADILINPLGADTWFINVVQLATDLLGAPVFADHLLNPSPHRIRNTATENL